MNAPYLSPREFIAALHALRHSPLSDLLWAGALIWAGALLGFTLAAVCTGTPLVRAVAFLPFLVLSYFVVCLLDAVRRTLP